MVQPARAEMFGLLFFLVEHTRDAVERIDKTWAHFRYGDGWRFCKNGYPRLFWREMGAPIISIGKNTQGCSVPTTDEP
jgi:hypothetical protein